MKDSQGTELRLGMTVVYGPVSSPKAGRVIELVQKFRKRWADNHDSFVELPVERVKLEVKKMEPYKWAYKTSLKPENVRVKV